MELFAAISFATTLVVGLDGRPPTAAAGAHDASHAPSSSSASAPRCSSIAAILEVAGLELARAAHPWAYRVEVLALLAHSASASCMSFAVWRLFHPDEPWALRLCLLQTALLFTSWQAVILPGQHTYVTGFTPWFHLQVASRGDGLRVGRDRGRRSTIGGCGVSSRSGSPSRSCAIASCSNT